MNNASIKNNSLRILLVMVVLLWSIVPGFSQVLLPSGKFTDKATFKEYQEDFNTFWGDKKPEKGKGWKQFKRFEYFWQSRLLEDGSFPNALDIYNEWQAYSAKNKSDRIQANEWKFIGPNLRPEGSKGITGLGRINCLTFDPNNENIIWVGAASGGIWKTTNGGNSWMSYPLTEFLSIGISDIAVAASDNKTVYACTGDADGAMFGTYPGFSVGMIKTTNGGQTWDNVSQNMIHQPSNGWLYYRVIVHPQDAGLVYAATNNGVMKSTDGGKNWTKIHDSFCRDLEMKSSDPNVLIGAFMEQIGGQYYSILKKYDATKGTWTDGQMIGGVGRTQISTSKANGNIIYALNCNTNQGFHSVWKTLDGGNTWTEVCAYPLTPNYLSNDPEGAQQGGQGVYDLALGVSPKNANEIYIGGINIWKSTNGGSTFTLTADWMGAMAPYVHADIHSLIYSNNGVIFAGHDGGLSKSMDAGKTWIDITDGLGITQFYRMAHSAQNKSMMMGGSQDNGTSILSSGNWNFSNGGDGMECLIDPKNSNIVYSSLYYGSFFISTNGGVNYTNLINSYEIGELGDWVTPITFDPKDPTTLYAGYKNVWKITNRGGGKVAISNFSTNGPNARCIAVSPSDSRYIYVGYNFDGTGNYKTLVTKDGGQTWELLYNSGSLAINSIAVHPTNPNKVWLALGGFVAGSKVIEITDGKAKNVSGSLINVPVNSIIYQNNSPDRLYIGTDVGVFMKDGEAEWMQYGTGLPNVVVSDLEIHYNSKLLRAATYGRGIWETELNVCSINPPNILVTGDTTFCSGDSVQLEVSGIYSKYEWSNGSTSKRITVKTSGQYYCDVTDNSGCSARSRSITVSENQTPNLKITVKNGSSHCEGDTIALTASFGYDTYKWSNGSGGRQINVFKAGEYYVTGTTGAGCQKISESISIAINPIPTKPTVTVNNNILTASAADKYQWYLEKGKLNGATGKEYTATKSGNYSVQIWDKNECSNTSEEVYVSTTDVNDFEAEGSELVIRPNPTSGDFEIHLNGNEVRTVTLKISSVLGTGVFSQDFTGNSGKFSIESFVPGVYYIEVTADGKKYFGKLIKE